MALKPTVVSGAADVQRAVAALQKTVKETGLKSPATHQAEVQLTKAMAQEEKLFRHATSQFSTKSKEVVALGEAHTVLSQAEKALASLSTAERKAVIAEFVPKGTQWPQLGFLLQLSDASKQLQKLANSTGKPQAYLFNDYPLVAMPKSTAKAAEANWGRLQSGGVIADAGQRLSSLGYDVESKQEVLETELKMAEQSKKPARSLEKILASLEKLSPKAPLREGVFTLTHPGEMKLVAQEVFRTDPKFAAANLRFLVNEKGDVRPGTEKTWNKIIDELERKTAAR